MHQSNIAYRLYVLLSLDSTSGKRLEACYTALPYARKKDRRHLSDQPRAGYYRSSKCFRKKCDFYFPTILNLIIRGQFHQKIIDQLQVEKKSVLFFFNDSFQRADSEYPTLTTLR